MRTPLPWTPRVVTALLGVLPFVVSCAINAEAPGGAGTESPYKFTFGADSATAKGKPRLVVMVVVDQLRGDLLDRYSSVFTGGFKRLLDEGLVYSNALHDHAGTETAAGHAAIATGVYPARAGIPANAWREGTGADMRPVYHVLDPEEDLVGIRGSTGASPRVLRRTGIADWMIMADPTAKVLSFSAKDRAAVLTGGKNQVGVYWFDAKLGRFVTSTYYRSRNPSWLSRFNEAGMGSYRGDSVWASTVPPEVAHLSAPDTADFEGDGVHTYFPHRFYQELDDPRREDFFLWFEQTPMLDRTTLVLAQVAVSEEGLGQEYGRTDFLSLSLSQTDRVGHAYGPLSREQMDNLLRLDRGLGKFFDFLDNFVGHENYVVGFTSDHGVLTVPERFEGGGLRLTDVHRTSLEKALLNAIEEAGKLGEFDPTKAMANAVSGLPFVGPVYTQTELLVAEVGDTLPVGAADDSLFALFQHSYTPGRAAGLLSTYGVEMWWAEKVLSWNLEQATTHGSPYLYDRWVPLILMGPGIEAGRVDDLVTPMDLAPTLAEMARIPFPDDLNGKPLIRVLDGKPVIQIRD
jgi:predicted AlkP superfamily pyrophosphatase or phosphodiesterase